MCHAAVRVNSISIHSLHTEGDHVIFCTLFLCFMYFNPLPPHGGRPVVQHRMRRCRRHFNPLPPHGGRPSVTSLFVLPGVISIHSLRMEGDGGKMTGDIDMASFQSTPSAWRETFFGLSRDRNSPVFQSTPSAWRETPAWFRSSHIWVFQSTPSAWRETVETVSGGAAGRLFQSTPSAWRETAYRFYKIRIEEHFNPLPPHGGRRGRMYCRKRCMNFNPLPPHGGRPLQVKIYRNF